MGNLWVSVAVRLSVCALVVLFCIYSEMTCQFLIHRCEPSLIKCDQNDSASSFNLRILQGKKHPSMKLQRIQKYEYGHLGRWYIKADSKV